MLLNYQIFIETYIKAYHLYYNPNNFPLQCKSKNLLVKLKLKEKNEVHHGNGTWICNDVLEKITIRDHVRDAKKEYES
jgi:hypothetical protein